MGANQPNTALHCGDCLDVMPCLEAGSIDMVLCDLPYGTSYAPWDSIIPLPALWDQYRRLVRSDGAIVLLASQPFTSALVMSNVKEFRCEWIWDKVNAANFANARRQPLKVHESVLVFSRKASQYFPIKVEGKKNHAQGSSQRNASDLRLINGRSPDDLSGMKFPKSIQTFAKHSSQCRNHPTEKPVALNEYLVRTYSEEGATVLDNTMGSGSTGVACVNAGRRFVGIERDPGYFAAAQKRIREAGAAAIERRSAPASDLFDPTPSVSLHPGDLGLGGGA